MTSVKVSGVEGISSQTSFQNVYAISMNGYITLPVLGDIRAEGLTTQELKDQLIFRMEKFPIYSFLIFISYFLLRSRCSDFFAWYNPLYP